MKTLRYLVRISRDENSDWGASVPDLPGCVATAKTLDATLRRIEAAIGLHLAGLREDGVRPPRPARTAFIPKKTAHRVDFFATVEVSAAMPSRSLAGRSQAAGSQRLAGAGHVRETPSSHARSRRRGA